MSDVSRRLFMGVAVGATGVGIAMMEGGDAQAEYLGPKLRLSVRDLGVVADGTADDGALLTKGLADMFGTFETAGPRNEPAEIDFGDLTLHLKSPIVINQSFIQFIGSPKFFCDVVSNAIVVNAGGAGAIVFGTRIVGTFLGHVEGDAILYQQGSQGRIDVRNEAYVARAVVHVQGSYRNDFRIESKGEGVVSFNAYRESVVKFNGVYYNTINSNIFVVAYDCSGAAVALEESQGFTISGDIERAQGPGIDLFNCQNGLIRIYAEKNGLGSSNRGLDTPDDIRIHSGPGVTTPNSDGNIIHEACIGGEQITLGGQLVTPNAIHLIGAVRTLISGNILGGNVRIEANSVYTTLGIQSRFEGMVIDYGQYTVDGSRPGRMLAKAAQYDRLLIDATNPVGAMIGSGDNLLHLYGLKSFGTGSTLARNFVGVVQIGGSATTAQVTFPTPETDVAYFPILSISDQTGSSASYGAKSTNQSTAGFNIVLNAPPGEGQAVRVNYLIVRTG